MLVISEFHGQRLVMGKWSAGSLIAGYPRCIVGFDYRVWMQDQGTFPATIDNQMWPRQAIENSRLEENGFNLFDGPLEKIYAVQPPQDSILVAFDLPVVLVSTLASTFGMVPLPIGQLAAKGSWKFLGYDVVDPRTQSSGFYSFDWTKTEFASMCNRLSLGLNAGGLVDDELLAIKAAVSFDLLVSEHAPFAPCGVWIAGTQGVGKGS
jgi:hypothetical protein